MRAVEDLDDVIAPSDSELSDIDELPDGSDNNIMATLELVMEKLAFLESK